MLHDEETRKFFGLDVSNEDVELSDNSNDGFPYPKTKPVKFKSVKQKKVKKENPRVSSAVIHVSGRERNLFDLDVIDWDKKFKEGGYSKNEWGTVAGLREFDGSTLKKGVIFDYQHSYNLNSRKPRIVNVYNIDKFEKKVDILGQKRAILIERRLKRSRRG